MPGEAVTLQLGHYAGCVGAHWWGLQEAALRGPAEAAELRPAALLRTGRGAGGREIHTPRLVALELKGGVVAPGTCGESAEAPVAWDGAVADCRERDLAGDSAPRDAGNRRGLAAPDGKGGSGAADPALLPAPAASGSSSPELWSDYLSVTLHPRSLYVLRQYLHDGDCGCLEAFGQGESLLRDPGCLEELEDRLHFFVEECDDLQGFQVLCDLHNGFSGVGAKVTELLCDEYSGKGILSWGLTPVPRDTGDQRQKVYRLLNMALGLAQLSRHSSLLCPLSLNGSLGIRPQPPVTFPYLSCEASRSYHSSAILATALDTLTAPYRLCSSPGSMLHLADTLSFSGRKVVAAGAAVPFPALQGSSLPDNLCSYQDTPWKLLSSCREPQGSCCFAQSVVLRGMGRENPLSLPGRQPPSPLHLCQSTEQVLQLYLHSLYPGAFSTVHVLEEPCSTLPPYPQFFSPLLTRQGFLLDTPSSSPSAAVESIPVLAALQSSPALHSLLGGLCQELCQLCPRRWPAFFAAGVELEEFQEALEELRTLAQCYATGLEADESEDEGDSD